MLTKIEKHIGISDFRKHLSRYFKDAKKKPLIVAANRGNDTRVVIDVDLYNELIDAYEDRRDAECLNKLVTNEKEGGIPWQETKKEHGV